MPISMYYNFFIIRIFWFWYFFLSQENENTFFISYLDVVTPFSYISENYKIQTFLLRSGKMLHNYKLWFNLNVVRYMCVIIPIHLTFQWFIANFPHISFNETLNEILFLLILALHKWTHYECTCKSSRTLPPLDKDAWSHTDYSNPF